MTSGIIVQARMNSTRFPGKVMALLDGQPVLWHVLTRAKQIGPPVIVAAPCQPESEPIVELAQALKCGIFLGDEQDVLGRYAAAAKAFGLDIIMRITADCPRLDPDVCKEILGFVPGAAYASNVMPRTYERGLDCEAFTRGTLVCADNEVQNAADREHVTPWMQRNVASRANIESGNPDRAETNWCIDTPEQLEAMNSDN